MKDLPHTAPPDLSSLRNLAGIYKALADETRLQMMALLLDEPELCVCHLERALEITQSKASRHLRYLLNAGLLEDRREGVWMYYRVADDLSPANRAILATVNDGVDPAVMASLRSRLERSQCPPSSSACRDPKGLEQTS